MPGGRSRRLSRYEGIRRYRRGLGDEVMCCWMERSCLQRKTNIWQRLETSTNSSLDISRSPCTTHAVLRSGTEHLQGSVQARTAGRSLPFPAPCSIQLHALLEPPKLQHFHSSPRQPPSLSSCTTICRHQPDSDSESGIEADSSVAHTRYAGNVRSRERSPPPIGSSLTLSSIQNWQWQSSPQQPQRANTASDPFLVLAWYRECLLLLSGFRE